MYDALSVLQASVVKTATFNSVAINLRNSSSTTGTNRGGTPLYGLVARVLLTAITGTPSVVFKIQHSDDNSTWVDIASQPDAAFSASTGFTHIPFETDKPWVRLVQTMTGGSSPSITYSGDVGLSRP
jgi:hypothetical protein